MAESGSVQPREDGRACEHLPVREAAGGGTVRRGAARWLKALGGCVLLTAVMAGCSLLPSEPVSVGNVKIQLPPPPAPITVKVRQGDVTLSAQVAGQVQSTHVQNLYFSNGGRVASVAVTNGQSVAAGQVLASLATGGLPFAIRSEGLAIKRDQLAVEQLQAQDQATPPLNQDQAQQQAIQMQQAQLALQQDQTNLANDQSQLSMDEVIAPFGGVVNDVAVNPGDQVAAFQVVMVISDPRTQAFIAQPDSSTAQVLTVGMPFTMTLSTGDKTTYHGTIASVVVPTAAEIAAAEQSGNPNGIPVPQATLDVTDYAGTPPLGAAFTATILLQQAKNVLYLPADAVHEFGGSSYVELYKNGVISDQPVQVGLQGDTDWAITSGVTAGEEVVEP